MVLRALEKSASQNQFSLEAFFGQNSMPKIELDMAYMDDRYSWPFPFQIPFKNETQHTLAVSLYSEDPDDIPPGCPPPPHPIISPSELLFWTDDLEELEYEGQTIREGESTTDLERQEYPPQLETLTIAWRKFWKNADPNDRTACPKKSTVVEWLIDQGFSKVTAETGATIIKPQWARDKGW